MKMARLVQLALGLALTSVAPVSSWAQIVFTATATADAGADSFGYVVGNTYTFVITSAASFSTNISSQFSANVYNWSEETTAQDQMWGSIGGTGLLGSFTRPVDDTGDPLSSLGLSNYDSPGYMELFAGTDGSSGIGLSTPNSTALYSVNVQAQILPTFVGSGSYAEPFDATNGHMVQYFGSYSSPSGVGVVSLKDLINHDSVSFTITNMTVSAVPEPSTYAALAGLACLVVAIARRRGALGLVALRRRRTTA